MSKIASANSDECHDQASAGNGRTASRVDRPCVDGCREGVQYDDRRFDRELITAVIAINKPAADFPRVAAADLLAAMSATGIAFQIRTANQNTAHNRPPVRLICAIKNLNDASTARGFTTGL
jgi:hypothetical protein